MKKTTGASNPVEHFIIQNQYLFLVPAGKITSLSSHTNWEHIGVELKADNALKTAHIRALKNILKTENETKTGLAYPK